MLLYCVKCEQHTKHVVKVTITHSSWYYQCTVCKLKYFHLDMREYKLRRLVRNKQIQRQIKSWVTNSAIKKQR